MIEILKSCPCCGGTAKMHGSAYDWQEPEKREPVFWVACSECHMSSGNARTRAEAAELWNKRPDDRPQLSEMDKARFDSALELIRSTCRSYRNCAHCPLFTTRRNGLNYCRLETVNPADWLLFSEEEAHKEREATK